MLILAAEAVVHANAHIAAECGIAERVLIQPIEKIGGPGIDRDAASEVVTGGEIETGVAGISCEIESDKKKVTIGAHAGKIAGKIHIEAPKRSVQRERSGIGRPADETITRNQRGIKRAWRNQDTTVVMSIIAADGKPTQGAGNRGQVESSRSSKIRVEEGAKKAAAASRRRGSGLETDDVIKTI